MTQKETPEKLRQISDEELKQILEDHVRWVRSEKKEGRRADLFYTDLVGKDLEVAGEKVVELREANLETEVHHAKNALKFK